MYEQYGESWDGFLSVLDSGEKEKVQIKPGDMSQTLSTLLLPLRFCIGVRIGYFCKQRNDRKGFSSVSLQKDGSDASLEAC